MDVNSKTKINLIIFEIIKGAFLPMFTILLKRELRA